MDRPFFYIGTAYLWTLWLLALTGKAFALGLLIAAACLLAAELVCLLRHKKTGIVPAVLLSCVLACSLFLIKTQFVLEPTLALAGTRQQISGTVTAVLKDSSSGNHRCTVDWDGTKVQLISKTYVPKRGDQVSFRGKVYELGEGDPDFQRYYRSTGTYISVFCYDAVSVTPATQEQKTVREVVEQFRQYLLAGVSQYLPEELAGVLDGMLLGDKTLITEEQQEWFRRSGILHLFAVSGFHTSLWSMLLYRSLLKAGLGKRLSCWGGIAFTVFFMALTGFSKSGIRAGLMLLVFFLGKSFLLSVDSLNSLGFAGFLLCIGNPFAGGDSGLLLSYFATLGILSVYPILYRKLHRRFRDRKVVERLLSTLALSASTFVFTLPVVMLTFGSISLVSPLSNLLITGVSSPAIILGGVGAVLNGIPGLQLLTPWCFLVAGEIVRYVNFFCRILSSWRFSYLAIDSPSLQLAAAGCLLLVALTLLFHYSLPQQDRIPALQKGSLPRLTGLLCVVLFFGAALSYDLLK